MQRTSSCRLCSVELVASKMATCALSAKRHLAHCLAQGAYMADAPSKFDHAPMAPEHSDTAAAMEIEHDL